MDNLDLQILEQLQENGRSPFTTIAQKLSVVEGTIRNRVAKLINSGTVQIVAMADPHKVGYDAPAMIGVKIQLPYMNSAAKAIAALPQVSYVVSVSGGFELMVEVMCQNQEGLAIFLRDVLYKIPGVQHTETFNILHTYKMSHGTQPRERA